VSAGELAELYTSEVATSLSLSGMTEASWNAAGVQASLTKAIAVSFNVAVNQVKLTNPEFATRRRLAASRRLAAGVTFDVIIKVQPADAAVVHMRVQSATTGAGLVTLASNTNQQLADDVAAGLIPAAVPSFAVTAEAVTLTSASIPAEPQPAQHAPPAALSQLAAALIGLVAAGLLAGSCFIGRKRRSQTNAMKSVSSTPGPQPLALVSVQEGTSPWGASAPNKRCISVSPQVNPDPMQDSGPVMHGMLPIPNKSLLEYTGDGIVDGARAPTAISAETEIVGRLAFQRDV
jgi:hypothetical protein